MAAILVAGAIPSGLAAVIKDYQGLLVCRFFIGVLGSTFVCFHFQRGSEGPMPDRLLSVQ